ncbi:MAG: FHA domain-containing protein [Isosphaeraceae bacterium]
MNRRVALSLLDTPTGRRIHQWVFDDRMSVQIGRSHENDVVIADPYVSRRHLCFRYIDGSWYAEVLSPQGIHCGSRKVLDGLLRLGWEATNGFQFRLGPQGPHMRFELAAEAVAEEATRLHDAATPILKLDRDRLHRDVSEIAEGEYFRKLRASIDVLRESRRADRDEPESP